MQAWGIVRPAKRLLEAEERWVSGSLPVSEFEISLD
jgi:hypothetical protein